MTPPSKRIEEIRARLAVCHDKEPEKWDPETRSYSYPKWEEFANNVPADLTYLLALIDRQAKALDKLTETFHKIEDHIGDSERRDVPIIVKLCYGARAEIAAILKEGVE